MSDVSELIKTCEKSGVKLSVTNGNLKVDAPKETLSPEQKEQLRIHKAEIIKLLIAPLREPDPLRDFCGVCRALLFELPNGEWMCSTVGCTEKRVNEAKEFFRDYE